MIISKPYFMKFSVQFEYIHLKRCFWNSYANGSCRVEEEGECRLTWLTLVIQTAEYFYKFSQHNDFSDYLAPCVTRSSSAKVLAL